MVLYHVITTYQLLYCMVHREVFHKNDKAYLLLPDFIKSKFSHYMELKGVFFDEILVFINSEMASATNRDLFFEKINKHFRKVFSDGKLDINKLSHVYVAGAQGFFGAYLVNNGVPFIFVEEGCGLISQPEILENIAEGISLIRHQISKEFGLYTGENPLVKKRICNLNAQVEGFQADNLEHFDVVEQLLRVDEDFRDKVLYFFGINKRITVKENSLLLLTQHFANLKVMSFEEQKMIYKTVVDYFTQNYNLLIKPHPDDLMYYDAMFPESIVIRERFPSELIPFVFSSPPKEIMTISSTAINSLKSYFKEPIRFTVEYEKHFTITHKYYSILKTLSELTNYITLSHIYCCSADCLLVQNLLNYSDAWSAKGINVSQLNDMRVKKNSAIIFDDLFDNDSTQISPIRLAELIDEDSVLIFPNSKKKYIFYEYPKKEIFDHIVPVVIVRQDREQDEEISEVLYIYSKNRRVLEVVNEIFFNKELKSMDSTLSKQCLSEDQIRIKVLEGILEATEKRLNYYIKLEQELRDQLKRKS